MFAFITLGRSPSMESVLGGNGSICSWERLETPCCVTRLQQAPYEGEGALSGSLTCRARNWSLQVGQYSRPLVEYHTTHSRETHFLGSPCQVVTGPGLAHIWKKIIHDLFAVLGLTDMTDSRQALLYQQKKLASPSHPQMLCSRASVTECVF